MIFFYYSDQVWENISSKFISIEVS